MIKTLYEAPELTDAECVTVFATHIGRVVQVGNSALRFTMCELLEVGGVQILVPRVRLVRPMEDMRRDLPLVRACMAGERYLTHGESVLAARH